MESSNLKFAIGNLEAELQETESALRVTKARRDTLVGLIKATKELVAPPDTGSIALPGDEPVPPAIGSAAPPGDEPEPFAGVEIDLADAKNLGERLVGIAIAVGEPIDAWEASRYLVTQGYSKSEVRNLRPHVYNTLNDHPGFEKVGRGLFEYLPIREKVTPATGNLLEGMVH